jgi:predicted kinase
MDETRATARLPHLDVEIVHRRLPEEQAEQLAISLRASPSFDAFARHLEAQAMFWPWPAVNPFLVWQRLLQAAWQPWLVAARRDRLGRDG